MRLYLWFDGTRSGLYCRMDAAMVEEATTPGAYADGDSPGWAWNGTPHASTSYQLPVSGGGAFMPFFTRPL